ncbi:transmembrane protein 272-like [Leucoraja erinacea]|uniref:transmembrane protein 272-like n=1 Tax=Leucoraja erinaceus TaxID=7782 RepID=UPI002453ADB9|nr:transmembrane protein 272-like [Leucoraja erinacea]
MESERSFYTPLLQTIEEPTVSPAATGCMKVLSSLLAIASITIGTIYLDSCTIQHLIPIYLIVSGCFTLFFVMLSMASCASNDEDSACKLDVIFKSVVSIFSVIWFICGNVWIYTIYPPDYNNKTSISYCDKTVYLFAFWTTTVIYILMGVTLVLGSCALVCACVLGGSFLLSRRT